VSPPSGDPADKGLSEADLRKLEQEIPRSDATADALGLKTHYGTIEAAEEKAFPWLSRRRRQRRSRRTPFA
jgi:hypothetical protein